MKLVAIYAAQQEYKRKTLRPHTGADLAEKLNQKAQHALAVGKNCDDMERTPAQGLAVLIARYPSQLYVAGVVKSSQQQFQTKSSVRVTVKSVLVTSYLNVLIVEYLRETGEALDAHDVNAYTSVKRWAGLVALSLSYTKHLSQKQSLRKSVPSEVLTARYVVRDISQWLFALHIFAHQSV